jgi:hypothetical protein
MRGLPSRPATSLPDALSFGQDPHDVEHIQPDEPNFVDQSRLG